MSTTEIYSCLWQCQALCDYVAAVAPSTILRYVMRCRGDAPNAYIINVQRRQKGVKRAGDVLGGCKKKHAPERNKKEKKKHSPESPHCLQGPEGAAGIVGESESPGSDKLVAASGVTREVPSRGVSTGHWIALVINRSGIEVFDSLGEMDTSIYGREVEEFVKVNDCHFVNIDLLDTKHCAFYCLLFCYYKCLGLASTTIVEKLKKYRFNIVEKCKRVFFPQ